MFEENSHYTITVYELSESGFDFGLRDYPIFDEEYRPILNNAILEHYKWREIGFKNANIWKDRLNNRMKIIMRNKYNELYKNKMVEFNPLYNIDITEKYEHTIDNTNNVNATIKNDSVSKSTNNSNAKESEENSNKIHGVAFDSLFPSSNMVEGDLTEDVYANSANNQNSEGSSTNETTSTNSSNSTSTGNNNTNTSQTNNGNTKENYTRKTIGSSAGLPFSKAMLQFKQYVEEFNLDQQVIDELKDLFITLW